MSNLKTITKEELQEILDEHKLWLEGTGKGKRADLTNIDLSNISLKHVDYLYR